MASLNPIAMSQTKEDLIKHLDLPLETYALMAKETDVVYDWLITHKSHLKENGKRKAPFDWSDIQERAKDDAMAKIARGGDQYTDYYWNLGASAGNNPNWVAKWFLYHKFRYRDGRNRAPKSGEKQNNKRGSPKLKQSLKEHQSDSQYDHQETTTAGPSSQGYYPTDTSTSAAQYEEPQYNHSSRGSSENNGNQPGTYYDPVRDV